MSVEFNRFLDYYRHAPDLNPVNEGGGKGSGDGRAESKPGRCEKGYKWVRLNVGLKHKGYSETYDPSGFIGRSGKRGVGKIDLRRDVTFISVASNAAAFFANELNNSEYRGSKLRAEIVKE